MKHRSTEVEAYFEYLDELAEQDSRWGTVHTKPPVRVKVSTPPKPQTRALPNKAPLNFFDPKIYNQMPKKVRQKITNLQISIAPLPHARGLKTNYDRFLRKFKSNITSRYIGLDEDAEDELDEFLSSDDDDDDVGDGDGDGDRDRDDEDEDVLLPDVFSSFT